MSIERLREGRCPVCGKESLEDTETGSAVYAETAAEYARRYVSCGWGCGEWLMPPEAKVC